MHLNKLISKNWDEDPKLFSSIMALNPNFLFSDVAKKVVLNIYRKYLYGSATERKKAKTWLEEAFLPKKRGRNPKIKKARNYPPEFIAEICWDLWGYFNLIKYELKELEREIPKKMLSKHEQEKDRRENLIVNKLYKKRPDLPMEKGFDLFKLLRGDVTPQALAISETASMLYISTASVREAIHPRKNQE